MKYKKVLLIGGAGYVGTRLVDYLVREKYEVTILDLFIYQNNIAQSEYISFIKADIRDNLKIRSVIKNFDIVIHLACISNDPSFDLNPELSKSINYSCFEPLVKICKDNGVKKFLFASSSSVYGIKDYDGVIEDAKLEPLTDYSKYKVMCEEILQKYKSKEFVCAILRPATVCGFSRRQRFDLVVNILTNLAFNKKEITVFGGDQLRPNININDMCRSYLHLINADENLINGEVFNVGFENQSVLKLAETVKKTLKFDVVIKRTSTDDNRSYHVSSEKIKKKLNFHNKFTIEDAIKELADAFEKNYFSDPLNNEMYFNIKRMKNLRLV